MIYDIIIIGAGVVGGAIARELSRYELSVLCLEKETDVCCGVSKSNTGIVHTPCLVKGPSKKAELNLRGNLQFDKLADEMGIRVQWPGALVLAYSEEDREILKTYKSQGEKTRKECGASPAEYKIIEKDDLKRMEPQLSDKVICALFAPDTGRVIPYELGTALWENAVSNGVELKLNSPVQSLSFHKADENSIWLVETSEERYEARYVINSAGHGSEAIGREAGFGDSEIQKVKGQYLIYNRERDFDINHILFQVPERGHGKAGKGILLCKTVYGNLMIGPDARWVEESGDTGTDTESLEGVLRGARKSIPALNAAGIIKTFAGVRPKPKGGDFIIESKNRFVHLCGIESPGLTSSPAIAEEVLLLLENQGLELNGKSHFNPKREPIVREILNLPKDELKRRIELDDEDEEQIVCRCEQVPRKRILDAIGRGIRVDTLDAVKRRTRAGQGRCQGAFCGKRVRKLLSEKLGVPEEEITQRGSEPLGERIRKLDIKP